MDLLTFDRDALGELRDPVLVVALDGWTDAGQGGTMVAAELQERLPSVLIGSFDGDALFDYRDRRPLLAIDRGILGDPQWPAVELWLIRPADGPDLLLVTGSEPDLSWQGLCRDLQELAADLGVRRHVGLGAVPGPVPHTRPVRLIATSSDEPTLERIGRPHEQVIVPASCQVVIEAALRDVGLATLGMWARIPHYVAGEYPAAAKAIAERLVTYLSLPLDTAMFDEDAALHRTKLDVAAASSPEISEHIRALEEAYDADVPDEVGLGGPLPTGDEIAAEFERFLRDRGPTDR